MNLSSTTIKPPKPSWLRVRAPTGKNVAGLNQMLRQERLNTVCASAACPNLGECWDNKTATFMILGNQCTRACRFCKVQSQKRPDPVDLGEPKRILIASLKMGLRHVVITSVARDDLIDQGADQFVRCLALFKKNVPKLTTEVLVPDFCGNHELIERVVTARPTIFNHNLETVRRITPKIRSGAKYDQSLEVLAFAKKTKPEVKTKSGLMLGLGETDDEIFEAIKDLRAHAVDQLTIGQYLQPTSWHHPIHRYVIPEKFAKFGTFARDLGFSHVVSGPLVRSSYHAEQGV